MVKVIYVEACNECPYYIPNLKYCEPCGIIIGDDSKINKWCTLEDV